MHVADVRVEVHGRRVRRRTRLADDIDAVLDVRDEGHSHRHSRSRTGRDKLVVNKTRSVVLVLSSSLLPPVLQLLLRLALIIAHLADPATLANLSIDLRRPLIASLNRVAL